MTEDFAAEPSGPVPPPSVADGTRGKRHLILGMWLIISCCAMLAYVAGVERSWLDSEPWSFGLARVDSAAVPEGARAAQIRLLPREALPKDSPLMMEVRGLLETAELAGPDRESSDAMLDLVGSNLAETLVMFSASGDELSKVLASGRLPQAGQREVLAGELARQERFTLDGEEFRVVGRIKPSTGGLAFSYVLPEDPQLAARHFTPDLGAKQGWYMPDARGLAAKEAPKILQDQDGDGAAPYEDQPFAQVPTRNAYYAGTYIALFLGAVGGYLLHAGLFAIAARRRVPLLGRLGEATTQWPRLFLGMHLFLYGIFFVAMARGAQLPHNNIAIARFVAGQFTSGQLSYIGDAYASGDILHAAVATFQNNYVLQTLILTFGTSVVPLAPGIIKTALSFVLVGFTLTPIWAGTADGFTYHSITMVFELEAYIVACFVVAVWSMNFYRALLKLRSGNESWVILVGSVRLYAVAMVVTGIMLALAAAYEAATLILFSGV